MLTSFCYLAANPFTEAYQLSDLFGKGIFIALIFLSIWSWTLLLKKGLETHRAKKQAWAFEKVFQENRAAPLTLEYPKGMDLNPFLELYLLTKQVSLELLHKNRSSVDSASHLSDNDIDSIHTHLYMGAAKQMQRLEKHLYLLSMIVSLAPFVGLLGTVWGILIALPQLQAHTSGGMHQAVLGGLSLALATTVLGLLDAIPALLGYSYLKNDLRNFGTEMEGFATELISSIEMQYRK